MITTDTSPCIFGWLEKLLIGLGFETDPIRTMYLKGTDICSIGNASCMRCPFNKILNLRDNKRS